MKLDYRYQGLTNNLEIKATGNQLGDVQRFGVRIIVDYKLKRFAYQGIYPVARPLWHLGLPGRGDIPQAR